jgi:hypothetical protein
MPDRPPSLAPPSLPRRLWALAQAIGWTGLLIGLTAAAIVLNLIVWAVQFDPESNSGYWLRRRAGVSPELGQVAPAQIRQKESLAAAELREALSPLPETELAALNQQWLRAYLSNFQEQTSAVVLLRGNFVIIGARSLRDGEFMPDAAALLAQSADTPDVFIELIAPAPRRGWNRDALRGLRGKPLVLAETGANTTYAVVHVSSLPLAEAPLLLTVVAAHPARAEGLALKESDRIMAPPRKLRPADLPALNLELEDFLSLRENAASQLPPFRDSQRPVQFISPGKGAELPPLPEPDLPKLSALLGAPAAPAQEGEEVAETTPTPLPAPPPPPLPPPPTGAAARKLAAEIRTEMISWESENWPLYASGQMPRGRLLALADAVKLRGYPLAGDPYYLTGTFQVTASGPRRYIMRLAREGEQARFSPRDGEPARPVRFILDFPVDMRPLARGAVLERGVEEPFQLFRVENSGDGQLNVYLREVIAPGESARGVAGR